jgi:hypothetical protein
MNEASLTLSTKGLSHVPVRDWRNNFEFIVGEAIYRCPSVIEDFLSQKISDLHSMDDTISRFVIATKDSKSDFKFFLGLGRGQPVIVTESNRMFFESICKEFSNVELYQKMTKAVGGELSVANIVSQANCLKEIGSNYEEETEFLASHFCEISRSDIDDIDFNMVGEAIGYPGLKVEDED